MADDEKPDELGEATADQRPDWLPDNFKTPEDMARSYGEATRKISEQGSELSELRGRVESLTESIDNQPPPQQQYGQDDLDRNPLVIRSKQAWETGDMVEFMRVQAEIAQAAAADVYARQAPPKQEQPPPDLSVIATLAEQEASRMNPDYGEHKTRMEEILQQSPHLFPDGSLNGALAGMNTALQIARGEAYARQQASDQAKQAQQEADRARKLDAQTLPGGGNRPPSPDEAQTYFARIANAGSTSFQGMVNQAREK